MYLGDFRSCFFQKCKVKNERKFITNERKMPQTCGVCGGISWLRGLNMGRTREVLDLLSLGKNISELMQRLSSESLSNPQESWKNG